MTFEKEMDLIFEVKGIEASCLEVTSIEVKGMRNLEKLGNIIFEVMHFEMEYIEVMIL